MARGQRGLKEGAKYNCDNCGLLIRGIKAYYIWQHQRQNVNRKGFCSKDCSDFYKSKEVKVIKCGCCGLDIFRLQSQIIQDMCFCSSKCSAKYNNAKRYMSRCGEETSEEAVRYVIENGISFCKEYICEGCGKKIKGHTPSGPSSGNIPDS